ncbi:MAG TPA: PKD domain-containing protein [Planctomycetota bacterium]
MQRFAPLVAVAAFAAASTAQFTLVTPNGYANTGGNVRDIYPWARGSASMRIQFLIDSTHFTAQGVTTAISISSLRYRAASPFPIWWAGGTWPNVRIDMATSPLDWSLASTTFANNLGPDRATVLQGPVTVIPGTTTGMGGVGPWYITIPLATPFLYDPTSGNDLTIDIHLDGTGWSGTSCTADFVAGTPAAGAARGCRVYDNTGITATTGSITTDFAPVTEFTYVPTSGLWPFFNGSPRTPSLGQAVQFSDQTYTSDPGGVTSWAWDVDGVPGVDYTTQHCSHTYTTEGPKSVTLTVTSASFGTQSLTRTDYIVVDAVDASFSASISGTTSAVFTDRSAGNPTSWAWDFQNDGIVDSTLQNPVHTYPAGTTQSLCRLTVADAFSNDTATVNLGFGIVPVPAYGGMFPLTPPTLGFCFQSPTRFSVIAARVPDQGIISTQNVAIFRLAGAPPILPATASGGLEFFALSQPVASAIPCVVSYDAGEYVGVLGSGGNFGLISSRLASAAGPYASSVLGAPTTLTRFSMQFNINTQGPDHPYSQEPAAVMGRVILDVTACAAVPYGTGSPSGLGPAAPKMRANALPFVGQMAAHTVEQNDAIVLQWMAGGFGRASVTLPPFGTILIGSLDLFQIMNGGAPVGPGTTTWFFAVPNLPSLVGATINFQNINLELQSGAWSMSNGLEWVIGL